jgi:hypothetical protein
MDNGIHTKHFEGKIMKYKFEEIDNELIYLVSEEFSWNNRENELIFYVKKRKYIERGKYQDGTRLTEEEDEKFFDFLHVLRGLNKIFLLLKGEFE